MDRQIVFNKYKTDLKTVERVTIDNERYLKVDGIQGSIMLFPRHEYNMSWGICYYGAWEPAHTEFLKRVIKPGMACIDVGAFIGYYTMLLGKLVGPKGCVFSFEPSLEAFLACKSSAKLNGYNVEIYRNPVSNVCENVNYVESSLCMGKTGEKISTIVLDSKFESNKIDFVKMDTEGYDGKVLFGMKKIIEKNPNILISMEYCPVLLEKVGHTPVTDIVDFCKLMNLEMLVFREDGNHEKFDGQHMAYNHFSNKTVEELANVELSVETLILGRENIIKNIGD